MGFMRLEIGAAHFLEGLSGIFVELTVKGRIGKLFECFGLVVRVIRDYRGGSLVSRADQNEDWR